MKHITLLVFAIFAQGSLVSAANLMFDFGPTSVGTDFLTLSPGHATGAISSGEIYWNNINNMNPGALSYSNNTSASTIGFVMGQEVTGGNNLIDFANGITNLGLLGNGGAIAGRQKLLTAGSIYGADDTSTAVGRDGFFGGYSSTGPNVGTAIGLRLDGLAPGQYLVFVMARNTNSNANTGPMNVFSQVGASSETFDISSLSGITQSNPSYPSADYTDGYSTFKDKENYVRLSVTIAEGDSLFIAVDGGSSDGRGFLNMLQVVQIPEPGTAMLGVLGGLFLLRRRR